MRLFVDWELPRGWSSWLGDCCAGKRHTEEEADVGLGRGQRVNPAILLGELLGRVGRDQASEQEYRTHTLLCLTLEWVLPSLPKSLS